MIEQGRLTIKDFEDLEQLLLKNPQAGEVISGLNGLRKIRLKGSNTGKRDGFRVDYLDIPEYGKIYMIVLYAKNIKDDLSSEEKKIICSLVKKLKEEATHG